uniref:Uncharacterized protein n=1 Tax=Cacopsylla melanoneura TaxID=428564 RepID=A0A8D8RB17_9HEMI
MDLFKEKTYRIAAKISLPLPQYVLFYPPPLPLPLLHPPPPLPLLYPAPPHSPCFLVLLIRSYLWQVLCLDSTLYRRGGERENEVRVGGGMVNHFLFNHNGGWV